MDKLKFCIESELIRDPAYEYNNILHRDRVNQISKFMDIKLNQNDSDTRNLEVV